MVTIIVKQAATKSSTLCQRLVCSTRSCLPHCELSYSFPFAHSFASSFPPFALSRFLLLLIAPMCHFCSPSTVLATNKKGRDSLSIRSHDRSWIIAAFDLSCWYCSCQPVWLRREMIPFSKYSCCSTAEKALFSFDFTPHFRKLELSDFFSYFRLCLLQC